MKKYVEVECICNNHPCDVTTVYLSVTPDRLNDLRCPGCGGEFVSQFVNRLNIENEGVLDCVLRIAN